MLEETRAAPAPVVTMTRKRFVIAAVLVLLSLVDKLTVGPLTLAGRETLSILAGVVLLWPLLWSLAQRGGSAEFLGIKLQLNELERKTEADLAIDIQSIRMELADLRKRTAAQPERIAALEPPKAERNSAARQLILRAADEYKEHIATDDWRGRAGVDLRLTGIRISVSELTDIIRDTNDRELLMAAAVVAGSVFSDPESIQVAQLLSQLLQDDHQRVRHRAAQSAERQLKRPEFPQAARAILASAARRALDRETHRPIADTLRQAVAAA